MPNKIMGPLMWFSILAVVGTLMHIDMIDKGHYLEQQLLHEKIATHTAEAPYQYRMLQPMLVEGALDIAKAEPGSERYKVVFLTGYAGIRLLAIFITYVALFAALRCKWPDGIALLGTTALAAFLPFTYRYYYYQPTSVVEMAFFALGLLVIFKRAAWALVPLTVLGTLNRETMCFIPLTYFMYWLPQLKRFEWVWLAASAVGWLSLFAGLRLYWPATQDLQSLQRIQWYISENIHPSRKTLDVVVVLAPALLVALNYRRLPPAYIRLALCALPWILLHFFTALWHEIRYYIPLLIWLLPSLMIIFTEPLGSLQLRTSLGATSKRLVH